MATMLLPLSGALALGMSVAFGWGMDGSGHAAAQGGDRSALSAHAGGDHADVDRAPATGAARLMSAKPRFPGLVQQALARGRQECLAEGGAALTYDPDIVRIADLTGDGRADYVVDFRAGRCHGREGMFNGTGGWDLDIFVAEPTGEVAWVFSGRVRDYDVSAGPGPRIMTFYLHGGFCGLGGVDECIKTRRMDADRFEFREP